MTPTPLFAETPRPARRAAVLLAHASLALLIATALCVLDDEPVGVIFALPGLALICLVLAIELNPATREEVADPATHDASARGLWELELYANRGAGT
jgi:hypothetical protein